MSLEHTRAFLGNTDARSGKMLERLVAALHGAAGSDMRVKWNDTIAGRQFDVTLRFRKGLHDYLTVIECKDFASRVPVEKVEAFVTKARDAGAHKAVMVSGVGFQSGAVAVAQRHGIKLLTLEERFPPEHAAPGDAEVVYGVRLFDLRILPTDKATHEIEINDAAGELHYIFEHAFIFYRGAVWSPKALLHAQHPHALTTVPTSDEVLHVSLPGAMYGVKRHQVLTLRATFGIDPLV